MIRLRKLSELASRQVAKRESFSDPWALTTLGAVAAELGIWEYNLDVVRFVEQVTGFAFQLSLHVHRDWYINGPLVGASVTGYNPAVPGQTVNGYAASFVSLNVSHWPTGPLTVGWIVVTDDDGDQFAVIKDGANAGIRPELLPDYYQPLSANSSNYLVQWAISTTGPGPSFTAGYYFGYAEVPDLYNTYPYPSGNWWDTFPQMDILQNRLLNDVIVISPNWKSLVALGDDPDNKRAQAISAMKNWENLKWDADDYSGYGFTNKKIVFADEPNIIPAFDIGTNGQGGKLDFRYNTSDNYPQFGPTTPKLLVNFHGFDSFFPNTFSNLLRGPVPRLVSPYDYYWGSVIPPSAIPKPNPAGTHYFPGDYWYDQPFCYAQVTRNYTIGERTTVKSWSPTLTDKFGNPFTLHLQMQKLGYGLMVMVVQHTPSNPFGVAV